MGQVVQHHRLDRREAVARMLRDRGELLVVTGLGSPGYDVMAAGDHDRNYYLWAAMGGAAMVGLGLAAAQPSLPVLVVTGDGEALMGFGAFATIAVKAPLNLTIAVLDNGHYGETGMQVSHTGRGVRLDHVAQACGWPSVVDISDLEGIDRLRGEFRVPNGPRFARIGIKADEVRRALPPRDSVFVKNRFRAALGFRPI